jgi:nickel-dependent lactate racemase
VKLTLRYGTDKISVELPKNVEATLLQPAQVPAIGDVSRELKRAVERPTDSQPLSKLVKEGAQIAIVVSDGTRSSATSIFLEPLINMLNKFGVKDGDITILVAYGSHERHVPDELRALLGAAVARRISIEHHDCYDEQMLIPIGETSQGVPVAVNRILLDSNLVIATGAINYHYFAGYGGGRKSLVPGCAAYDTILANHRLTLSDVPDVSSLLNPYCDSGVLEENPVHDAALEAARMIPNVFLLNVVLNPGGEICGIFAGELDAAHREGCKLVDRIYRVEAPEPFGMVIASSGGFPHDVNFIQMHKGIHHASQIVADRGSLVYCGEARNGVGSEYFEQWFDYPTLEEMAEEIRREYTLNAHTAYAMREKSRRISIFLQSLLSDDFVRRMGIEPVYDVQHTVNEVIAKLGRPSIAIIPNANLLLPVLSE